MEEHARKAESAEFLLRILSACISTLSFWVIAFSWNYFFEELGFVPRLGLGAALSWVVFLHVESTGMIIMSMMRDKLRADARAEARSEAQEALMREVLTLAREALARADAREAQAQTEAREALARADAREAQAQTEAREALARADAREAQAQTEAREALTLAREAQAQAEAREAQLIIRDLRRQLREARGEGANGAEDA